MIRKLILSNSGFPEKFLSSNISLPDNINKQNYIERNILNAINTLNIKLKVSSIEYLNIREQFPHLNFLGKYTGLIVEDVLIDEIQRDIFSRKGYYLWESNNNIYARKPIIYIFMSDYEIKGRNIISQLFFPELIDLLGKYIFSPSFSIANYPIYHINFLNSQITANSIIKQLAGIIVSDVKNIEVFHVNNSLVNVPVDMKEFLNKYMNDFVENSNLYSTDNFEIDISNKITRIKTNKLVLGDYIKLKDNNPQKYQFNGSSEKFYWIDVLSIIFLSIKNNYKIDYTLLELFYTNNLINFDENDEKFNRFTILISFLDKIKNKRV